MRGRWLAAALVALAALALLVGVDAPPSRPVDGIESLPWRLLSSISALPGLLLILVLPGWALVAALFGRDRLDVVARVVLTLGLSLAVTIVSGIALGSTPVGARPTSWVITLAAVTILGAVAARRRAGRPVIESIAGARPTRRVGASQDRAEPPTSSATPGRRPGTWQLGTANLLFLAGAGLCGIAALSIARAGVDRDRATVPVTQLWMLAAESDRDRVRIGVTIEGAAPRRYLLRVSGPGQTGQVVLPVDLIGTDRWETTLSIQAMGSTSPITATLSRADAPGDVERRVTYWREPNQVGAEAAPNPIATRPVPAPTALPAPPPAPTAGPSETPARAPLPG